MPAYHTLIRRSTNIDPAQPFQMIYEFSDYLHELGVNHLTFLEGLAKYIHSLYKRKVKNEKKQRNESRNRSKLSYKMVYGRIFLTLVYYLLKMKRLHL